MYWYFDDVQKAFAFFVVLHLIVFTMPVCRDLRAISTDHDACRFVTVADFNGDGTIDVLADSYHDDELAWFQNILALCMFSWNCEVL